MSNVPPIMSFLPCALVISVTHCHVRKAKAARERLDNFFGPRSWVWNKSVNASFKMISIWNVSLYLIKFKVLICSEFWIGPTMRIAASFITSAAPWLLHGPFGQGKLVSNSVGAARNFPSFTEWLTSMYPQFHQFMSCLCFISFIVWALRSHSSSFRLG